MKFAHDHVIALAIYSLELLVRTDVVPVEFAASIGRDIGKYPRSRVREHPACVIISDFGDWDSLQRLKSTF